MYMYMCMNNHVHHVAQYSLQKGKENERKTTCYKQSKIYSSLSGLEKYIVWYLVNSLQWLRKIHIPNNRLSSSQISNNLWVAWKMHISEPTTSVHIHIPRDLSHEGAHQLHILTGRANPHQENTHTCIITSQDAVVQVKESKSNVLFCLCKLPVLSWWKQSTHTSATILHIGGSFQTLNYSLSL